LSANQVKILVFLTTSVLFQFGHVVSESSDEDYDRVLCWISCSVKASYWFHQTLEVEGVIQFHQTFTHCQYQRREQGLRVTARTLRDAWSLGQVKLTALDGDGGHVGAVSQSCLSPGAPAICLFDALTTACPTSTLS
jgi:hypothetical protein